MTVIYSTAVSYAKGQPIGPLGPKTLSRQPVVRFGSDDFGRSGPDDAERSNHSANPQNNRESLGSALWKMKWTLASVIALAGVGAGGLVLNTMHHTRDKHAQGTVAPNPKTHEQQKQALKKALTTVEETVRKQVTAAYHDKILARRNAEVYNPFCNMKNMDFVSFRADVDWQVIPGSKMEQDLKRFMEGHIDRTTDTFFWKVRPQVEEAVGKSPDQIPNVTLDKDQLNQTVEKARSHIGTSMPAFNYHLSNMLEDRATRLLKKHSATDWVLKPELIKRFQEEFLNGGTDFEGRAVLPLEQELAENGIQLHAIKLKNLGLSFDRIIIPLGAEKNIPH